MIRVLFVCMGNICRSPLAEGALRKRVADADLAERFVIDSAGTIGHHAGSPPDPRSVAEARKHGIDISGQRSRQIVREDLSRFDWVFVMDVDNLRDVERLSGPEQTAQIRLFLTELDDPDGEEVPDPYYGHGDGFARVWAMVDEASEAFLERVR